MGTSMNGIIRRALTEEERGLAIAAAFAKALQELPPNSYGRSREQDWVEIVDGVISHGYLFDWTPRFTRQAIVFAEHAASRMGYEIQQHYRFYGGFDEQTPPTLRVHLFRTHVPPDVAVRLIQRFEAELRIAVGADLSEAGTIAPPVPQ